MVSFVVFLAMIFLCTSEVSSIRFMKRHETKLSVEDTLEMEKNSIQPLSKLWNEEKPIRNRRSIDANPHWITVDLQIPSKLRCNIGQPHSEWYNCTLDSYSGRTLVTVHKLTFQYAMDRSNVSNIACGTFVNPSKAINDDYHEVLGFCRSDWIISLGSDSSPIANQSTLSVSCSCDYSKNCHGAYRCRVLKDSTVMHAVACGCAVKKRNPNNASSRIDRPY